ncbi:hypothetical protein BOX15_Mlig031489g1 [Macrostomum lignano]|uniref:Uncharacterized protein n=1 Tax=Macrostomum lignano TaxID=282301 RepID=A0A267H745_9PLAT|nr:hypothetical protein BOX15_Mlig031489g1 [Macrostomum lignano]
MDRHSAACSGDSDFNSRRGSQQQQQQQFFGGPSLRLQRRAAVFKARKRCNNWLESDLSNDDAEDEEGDEAMFGTSLLKPSKPSDRVRRSRIDDEAPINFMEVYHRLKLGDLGCQPAAPKQYWANRMRSAAEMYSAAVTPARQVASAIEDADSAGSSTTDLRQLRRLLRDRERVGSTTPPPVPKPRRRQPSCTVAPSTPPSSPQPPNPTSRRRRHPAPHESSCCLGPFASVAVSIAEPLEPPRHYRLMSERTAASSTVAGLHNVVCYYCADWELLRRLSITSRLLARDGGRAPTLWLSSAALLTNLCYPTCCEVSRLPIRTPATLSASAEFASPASATRTVVKWPAPNYPAKAGEPPLSGFAYKAMDRRRLRSQSGEAALRQRRRKSLSKLYAVPVA